MEPSNQLTPVQPGPNPARNEPPAKGTTDPGTSQDAQPQGPSPDAAPAEPVAPPEPVTDPEAPDGSADPGTDTRSDGDGDTDTGPSTADAQPL
ncbi:hypothetical protein LJY25_09010 [Hymenobacter sp. BT175]|uniref:hypothetical protein n=1 Tax=Hymenobacter translucens TaxID=2886507 RepID=UPI001D0EE095|nr:hypothetical protein [Hymenobacter translucens]MCC2546580.1 hypothetical protein [Hymenobacter translucens]